MNYKDLLKVWKDFKIAGVVISESPNIEGDAILMKKAYEKLYQETIGKIEDLKSGNFQVAQ